jgi:hypothetical protein
VPTTQRAPREGNLTKEVWRSHDESWRMELKLGPRIIRLSRLALFVLGFRDPKRFVPDRRNGVSILDPENVRVARDTAFAMSCSHPDEFIEWLAERERAGGSLKAIEFREVREKSDHGILAAKRVSADLGFDCLDWMEERAIAAAIAGNREPFARLAKKGFRTQEARDLNEQILRTGKFPGKRGRHRPPAPCTAAFYEFDRLTRAADLVVPFTKTLKGLFPDHEQHANKALDLVSDIFGLDPQAILYRQRKGKSQVPPAYEKRLRHGRVNWYYGLPDYWRGLLPSPSAAPLAKR